LANAAYIILPKVVIALLVLAVVGVLAGITRAVLHRVLRHWERTNAIAALARIGIWLLAIAAGLSILAGDVREAASL
jgi:small conductance mechanosensitive channel